MLTPIEVEVEVKVENRVQRGVFCGKCFWLLRDWLFWSMLPPIEVEVKVEVKVEGEVEVMAEVKTRVSRLTRMGSVFDFCEYSLPRTSENYTFINFHRPS
jgi:hypothetical protein